MTLRFRMKATLFIALIACTLVGCSNGQPEPEQVMNHPAGDLEKLQGRWSRPPHGNPDFAPWGELYLDFEGNTVTYDSPENRKTGQGDGIKRFRFVLNSVCSPKVLRYTHRFTDAEWVANPRGQDHPYYDLRYKLDGGTLTIWTVWTDRGEQRPQVYNRVLKT